ncbi:unnamed protein product [Rotaria sp. Silwood2]|nr:unnamed protein product [Rotaria sp. Silwood2]
MIRDLSVEMNFIYRQLSISTYGFVKTPNVGAFDHTYAALVKNGDNSIQCLDFYYYITDSSYNARITVEWEKDSTRQPITELKATLNNKWQHCRYSYNRPSSSSYHVTAAGTETFPEGYVADETGASSATDSTSTTPATTSSATDSTSTAPATTSSATDSTSTAPATTSSATDSTSTVPATTSSATDSTSTAPATTSSATDSTSTAPATTSSATDSTSTAPETTSTTSDITNTISDTTSTTTDKYALVPFDSEATSKTVGMAARPTIRSGNQTREQCLLYYYYMTFDNDTSDRQIQVVIDDDIPSLKRVVDTVSRQNMINNGWQYREVTINSSTDSYKLSFTFNINKTNQTTNPSNRIFYFALDNIELYDNDCSCNIKNPTTTTTTTPVPPSEPNLGLILGLSLGLGIPALLGVVGGAVYYTKKKPSGDRYLPRDTYRDISRTQTNEVNDDDDLKMSHF